MSIKQTHDAMTAGAVRMPSTPQRVGKYRVDGLIGRGAMGVVYLGHDEQIDRPLAIKTIRLDVLDDLEREPLLRRFATEARAAGRCLHPNIVTVFDYVEQDGSPYIVMEYVNAGTLDAVVRSGSMLPLQQIGEVVAQLLLALDHAHSKGLVHRDVKPANILCPSAASIKVTDFGVARFEGLGITKPGGVGTIGTPNYMSPEQFLGRPVDGRSDLFAVGVILYQLLTGERPFVAGDVAELMNKLLNEQPRSILNLRQDLSIELDTVVLKALARNAEDRFQSAEEFIEALNHGIEATDLDFAPPLDLTEIAPATRHGEEAKAQGGGSGGGSGSDQALNVTMAERLSASTLVRLESALARSIGPIARVVLKRAAKEATDAEKLVATLADQIPSEGDATNFRTAAHSALHEDHGLAAIQLSAEISERDIEAATEALTPMIGPMAKMVARKRAATAIGLDDYWSRLAEAIPSEKDRAAFLAQQPAKIGGQKQ